MSFVERTDIEMSYMRHFLIGFLKRLGNKEYQEKNWVNPKYDHMFWSSFYIALEFFESLRLDENVPNQLGYTLINEEEVKSMQKVIDITEEMCSVIGIRQPDKAYITSPLWNGMIEAASKAFHLLHNNDIAYAKAQGIGVDESKFTYDAVDAFYR